MQKVKSKHGDFNTNRPYEGEMFSVAGFSHIEMRNEDPQIESFKYNNRM